MSDEQNDEQTQPQTEPQEQAPFYEFKGRRFDSKESLDAFIEGVTLAQGSIAQKYGELKKEVEPLRRYNLSNATVDEAAIAKQVAQLRDDGNHVEADRLLFEYTRQVNLEAQTQREKERLWNDYVSSRADIFEVVDKDMARDYLFHNYSDKLPEVEDPFSFMDSVLQPKASRLQPKKQNTDVPTTLGAGNLSISTKPSKKDDSDEDPWAKAFKELGVK